MNKAIKVCIGTDERCSVRARLSLLVLDDDGSVMSRQYHSIDICPGADLAAIRLITERHLASRSGGIPGAPWPRIPDADWADVEAHCRIVHKPEVVAAYRESLLDSALRVRV